MLSIIMPFYRKFNEFKFALTYGNLKLFNTINDLELLVCVDAPGESNLLIDYLQQLVSHKKIRFSMKVLLNEEDHPWRCPSAAINVGIRQAQQEKLLVLSPETLPLAQSIESLVKNTTEQYFSLGIIKHLQAEEIQSAQIEQAFNLNKSPILPYGSICFTKMQAEAVGGYDESFKQWGGDDDDFRSRLKLAGFIRRQTLARFAHIELADRYLNRASNLQEQKSLHKVAEKINFIKEKKEIIANEGRYGLSFNKVIFDFKYMQPQLEMQ